MGGCSSDFFLVRGAQSGQNGRLGGCVDAARGKYSNGK